MMAGRLTENIGCFSLLLVYFYLSINYVVKRV